MDLHYSCSKYYMKTKAIRTLLVYMGSYTFMLKECLFAAS